VLVKQDPTEAKDTVTKRIEYITKEMYVIHSVDLWRLWCPKSLISFCRDRHDNSIKDLESKFEKHKQTLGSLQHQFQQLAMQAKVTAAN
jgi:chaperonin cofactor prefoldin